MIFSIVIFFFYFLLFFLSALIESFTLSCMYGRESLGWFDCYALHRARRSLRGLIGPGGSVSFFSFLAGSWLGRCCSRSCFLIRSWTWSRGENSIVGHHFSRIIYMTSDQETLILTIFTSTSGFSLLLWVLTFSILCTTSSPCTARPKTVCLLSNHGVFSVVMKN